MKNKLETLQRDTSNYRLLTPANAANENYNKYNTRIGVKLDNDSKGKPVDELKDICEEICDDLNNDCTYYLIDRVKKECWYDQKGVNNIIPDMYTGVGNLDGYIKTRERFRDEKILHWEENTRKFITSNIQIENLNKNFIEDDFPVFRHEERFDYNLLDIPINIGKSSLYKEYKFTIFK